MRPGRHIAPVIAIQKSSTTDTDETGGASRNVNKILVMRDIIVQTVLFPLQQPGEQAA